MRVALIGINSNLIQTSNQEKVINFIKDKLYEVGENISLISYFDNNYDSLRTIINSGYDLIFCVGSELSIYNHNIKENLCKIFNDRMENNNACIESIKKYCEMRNINFSVQEEMEVRIPTKAIALCDDKFLNTGFMYKNNSQYVIFLPSNIDFVKDNFFKYIMPLISDISNQKSDNITIRCYGILEKDIRTLISDELQNKDINIQILNKNLDNIIYIRYKNSINNINDILSSICTKLNKFIYSMDDSDLYKTATYLLNLYRKKVAIAETLTLGQITKCLCLEDSSVVADAFIFTNFDVAVKRLSLDKKVIDTYGKYSVNTVYELDNLLLEKTSTDIAVFVLGDKNLDICYIAIGDIDGIHVYKNKINSHDDNLIDNISNTALFYLIKKLRQNDLQFR